jgi:hypothetical protein
VGHDRTDENLQQQDLPLVLLILEAIQQRQLIKDDREFKYGLAYTRTVEPLATSHIDVGHSKGIPWLPATAPRIETAPAPDPSAPGPDRSETADR